jgi:hypothetical protein
MKPRFSVCSNGPRRRPLQLRRSIVEHPFANLKYRIFAQPRFLLRGLRGAQTEISLGVAAYHLKRMLNILGGRQLNTALRGPVSVSDGRHAPIA